MQDENVFENELLPDEFEPEVVEAIEAIDEDDYDDDDLEFLDELEDELPAGFERTVKLRTTSGSPVFVPVDEPITIATVLQRAQLKPLMETEFWVGGIEVDWQTYEVGPGAEVVIVGSVKGA